MFIEKLCLSFFAIILFFPASASAESVRLARDGHGLLPVVIGEKASALTKETAATLAGYLTKISGADFTVTVGDGSRGIELGTAADFGKLPVAAEFGSGPFEREDYVLRSAKDGRR